MPNSRGWEFAPTNNQNDSEPTLAETIVSVGTSSGSVLSADANRTFLLLINDSANVIYVSLAGNAAALNAGQRLNANGGSLLLDRYVPGSNLGEIRTKFEVKLAKSARIVEINHSRIAESASRAALPICKMLIAETIKGAFYTLQALAEVIIRAKSSIETLNLVIVA